MVRFVLVGLLGCSGGPIETLEGTFEPEIEGLEEGDRQTCAPASTPSYALGDFGEGWRFAPDFHTPQWDVRFGARGVVVADFDVDGVVDVIVPQTHERARLLLGTGDGGLVPGGTVDVVGAAGGSAADIDGDGDLDAFLYSQADPRREVPEGAVEGPVLLVNDGGGSFEVRPQPGWEDDFLGCGGSASWADVDLDGDLDLYFGRLGRIQDGAYQPCPSRFLLNDGVGGFEDASDRLPPDAQAIRVMASGFHAFDGDPEPELYLVADAQFENNPDDVEVPIAGNLLLDWRGDAWEVRPAPGLELAIAGMGLGAADLNDDGLVDVAVPDVGAVPLLLSRAGDGDVRDAWRDVAASWGLQPDVGNGQIVAWGGEFADADNDGQQDLVVTYGAIRGSQGFRQPDDLYRNTGEAFRRQGAAWGYADDRPNRGVVVADVDGNGMVDLVTRELGGHVLVHRAPCHEGAWLSLSLRQPGVPNGFGVGAKVVVLAGGERFVRWVSAGSTSFASGGPPTVHVGLGAHEAVDAIVVIWPDGEGQAWAGVPARQQITLTRQ